MGNHWDLKHAKACSLEDLKVKWGPGPNSRHEADLTNWGMPPSVAKFHPFWYSTRFHPAVCFNMFQPQFCLLHFASIPTFFACRTASFLVFYIPPKKNIWNRRLFKKRKLNLLNSSQLISSTPACDLAMLPPKLGSRNSGCQRLRCRVASSRTPGSSTAGAAGAAAGAFVGAGTWENAAEIHGFAIVSGQPFVGQLIWYGVLHVITMMLDGFYHLYPSVFFPLGLQPGNGGVPIALVEI